MNNTKRIVLILGILLSASGKAATDTIPTNRPEPTTYLTREQMYADFDFLTNLLNTEMPHPAIRRMATGVDIPAETQALRAEMDTVTCDAGFHDVLMRAQFLYNDPHCSFLGGDSTAEAALKHLYSGYRYGYNQKFPLIYTDGKYYTLFAYTDSLGHTLIQPGTRVTHVSGIPIDRYMATGNRRMQRNTRWDFKYNKFWSTDLNDPRTLGLADDFTLTLKQRRHKTVRMDMVKRSWPGGQRTGSGDFKIYYWDEDSILYIRLPRMDHDRIAWINEELQKHREAPVAHVVIDVRGNGGGSDAVWRTLLQNLLDRPLSYPVRLAFPNEENINYFTREYTREKIGPDSCFILTNTSRITPAETSLRFQGPIHVLFDEDCFSSTLSLLSVCQSTDRLVSVGSPSGYLAGIGVNPMPVSLPNSRIHFRFPLCVEITAGTDARSIYRQDVEEEVSVPIKARINMIHNFSGEVYGQDYLYRFDPVFRHLLKQWKRLPKKKR